jgi:hypothetical protein
MVVEKVELLAVVTQLLLGVNALKGRKLAHGRNLLLNI